jgi:hypothetical protein
VECIDITGDGKRDALFTVLSGGTAGTTHFGVIAGPGGVLVHYEDGYKVGVDAVSDTRFDVQQPIYKKDDANCCPSSFAVTPYRWTGTKFKAGKSTSHKKPSKRFF